MRFILENLPLKVPQQADVPVHFSSIWRWRSVAPSPRGVQNNWLLRGAPGTYNCTFERVPIRAPGSRPFLQSSGRHLRHFNASQPRLSAIRLNFPSKKRRRGSNYIKRPSLNPSDPLNLQDLMNETDRRRTEGLSPLHGDSRLNTPALSISGELSCSSPAAGESLTSNWTQMVLKRARNREATPFRGRGSFPRSTRRMRWQGKRLPITGNYPDYYCRRDPDERIKVLMPEWFSNSDVADYGCHNGTLTFRILEKFPDVHKIDAFDCDAELIENAKNMQRERIRWGPQSSSKFEKINFQVADWSESISTDDDPTYNTILAFSVTKWIHLNYGDAGLMRFFRRVFNLLKPGGHLLLEPQPKASYKKTRFTAKQQENFKTLTIDPSNLEPLLLDIGFSYFDKIKVPRPNEAFQRSIILCSKSYGATPSSIRNDCRDEAHLWRGSPALSDLSGAPVGPPPVRYCPQTPSYSVVSPATHTADPTSELLGPTPTINIPSDCFQSEVITSTVSCAPSSTNPDSTPGEATPRIPFNDAEAADGADNSGPDSTSQH
ncbi:unnamed protein product [Mesocestoides corti]|uniref:RNA methyltransferase n=1 Tax=Mesocestoides corti TaxID=53468 RepID=A0A0R3UKP1_MESCO|nr:unnamed protein product [Mesocestoides corti]